jgi:hypothetical protein
MKMRFLLPLFLALLVIGCKKKAYDHPSDPTTFIREVTSVGAYNLSVDTTLDSLPPLTGSFSSPKYGLVFSNRELYGSADDSLFIAINQADSIASFLRFDRAVRLPSIVPGEYEPGSGSIVLQEDSLSIASFESRNIFVGYDRLHSNTAQTFPGAISSYIFKRYYNRIHYTGELKLDVKDNKGNIVTLAGRFHSSKVGIISTAITVY